jgi:hypothetical protein
LPRLLLAGTVGPFISHAKIPVTRILPQDFGMAVMARRGQG